MKLDHAWHRYLVSHFMSGSDLLCNASLVFFSFEPAGLVCLAALLRPVLRGKSEECEVGCACY